MSEANFRLNLHETKIEDSQMFLKKLKNNKVLLLIINHPDTPSNI